MLESVGKWHSEKASAIRKGGEVCSIQALLGLRGSWGYISPPSQADYLSQHPGDRNVKTLRYRTSVSYRNL